MEREKSDMGVTTDRVWRPCTQMKDEETFPPITIARAEGPWLITADGRKIIDATSSWWCKSLGHGHPRVREAVIRQMGRFEHTLGAGTRHEALTELSERLVALCPGMARAFYSGDGSSGVEVALKMCLLYHARNGHPERNRFIAFRNGYHGETALTLAAGDCGIYGAPFKSLAPDIPKLDPSPYVRGEDDLHWRTVPETAWAAAETFLTFHADTLAGVLFEPIVQGAGGMLIYSPDFSRKLRAWADRTGVSLIADEIMTGAGRTGKFAAMEHAGVQADFVVLSKGLTSGWAPMTATLTTQRIYETFYGDYSPGKDFLHSNTFSGYALGAAAALETLNVLRDEDLVSRTAARSVALRERMARVAAETGCLRDVRGLGFIAAADLYDPATGDPFPPEKRMGRKCFRKALELGAWTRPLGDTLYFLPPLNAEDDVLDLLAEITCRAIRETLARNGK